MAADYDTVVTAAVQTQLSLVSSFDQWLAERAEADESCRGIVSRTQGRLESYRRWLHEAGKTLNAPSENAESWVMDARVQLNDYGRPESVIVVAGPGSGEPIEIVAKDQREVEHLMSDKCLGYMTKICQAFSKAQDTIRLLLQITSEVKQEESHLSQPSEATVKTYIRSLRDYNDMKDIGQQLIGLIAENRGVPIHSLYEMGDYGVSAPD